MLELSAAIIVQNEQENIKKCLSNIYNYVDEIIIIDGGSQDNTINMIQSFKQNKSINVAERKIKLYRSLFNGHFGDQKNLALSKCDGIWILNIDADELLDTFLLQSLKKLMRTNDYDAYAIPRKNFIDGKQTEIYPDRQVRLFRNYCRFQGAVHEELFYLNKLDLSNEYNILHYKSDNKQTAQNIFYKQLENEFKHKILHNKIEWS